MTTGTFAKKLDHLFLTVRPTGRRRPYSMNEVAASIAKSGHEHVSANYIWMLRKGLRDNPTLRTVEALAHFFGVPPSYFFEDDVLVPRLGTQLDPLAKMRDSCIRDFKFRAAELSPETRVAAARMIDILTEAMAKIIEVITSIEAQRRASVWHPVRCTCDPARNCQRESLTKLSVGLGCL